jgi:hypothetical protein
MLREGLSDDEILRLRAWRGEWLRISVDPAPADRPRAEGAIAELYARLGQGQPQFLWVDSPRCAGWVLRQYGSDASSPVRRSPLRDLFDKMVGWFQSDIDRQLAPALMSRVTRLLTVHDERNWEQREWNRIEREVQAAVPRQPVPAQRDPLYLNWGFAITAPQRSSISYLTAARDVLGVRYSPAASRYLDLWIDAIHSCGWWWPCQQACVVSERPAAVHLDDQERLHHPSEAALRYRDGFQLFFWHGTGVPREWITHPLEVDPRTAIDWPILEARQAVGEIIGWTRVIERLGHTVDRDPDPAIGHLVEVIFTMERARFLLVRCGTGREFALRVPPNTMTARQANAWTYGLRPEDYHLEVRT